MAVSDRTIRNVFIYITPKLATYGLNLLSLPILTRLLTPADFGVVALAWLFPTVAVSVLTAGIGFAVPRFYFEYRHDKPRLDALVFGSQVFLYAMLALSAVGVWFAREWIASLTMNDAAYGNALFLAYLAVYLEQIMTLYLRLYQNMERAVAHSAFTIGRTVVQVGVSLLLVWGFGFNYMGPIWGSFAGSAVACLGLGIAFANTFGKGVRLRDLWDNMLYGLQLVPKSFSGAVNRFFDKYLLNSMLSMSAVGIYAIGQQLSGTLNFMISTIWMSFQPEALREVFDRHEHAAVDVGRLFTIFAYACLLPVATIILFAEELVAIVAPPSYGQAVDVLVVLAAIAGAQVFNVFVGVQFAYSKRPVWVTVMTFVGAGVNIVANIALIPRFGLLGAATSAVITQWVVGGVLAVIGQRHYRVAYEWVKVVPLLTALFACVAAVLLMRAWATPTWAVYGVKAMLLAVLALLGNRAGLLTRAGLARLKGALVTGGKRPPVQAAGS